VTTGILYYGDNTPKNAVARMLIDDFDETASEALLNTAVTQAGVSIQDTAKPWKKVGAVLLDSGFQTNSPYDECRKPAPPKIKNPTDPETPGECVKTANNSCRAVTLAAMGATAAAIMGALF